VEREYRNGIAKIRGAWCECGLSMEEAVGAGYWGYLRVKSGKDPGCVLVCKKVTENIAIMAKTY